MKYLFINESGLINQGDSYTPDDVESVYDGYIDIVRFNPYQVYFERMADDEHHDPVKWEKVEEVNE